VDQEEICVASLNSLLDTPTMGGLIDFNASVRECLVLSDN
jgi:hypothetical protein